eukprot:779202_1
MKFGVNKYNSVDTDVHDDHDLTDYEPDLLTPKSKGIWKQWQLDKKDELIVDGYFRECNIIAQYLPTDIAQTIAAYYTKSQTKGYLQRRMRRYQRWGFKATTPEERRRQKIQALLLIVFIVILALLFVFGVDVSALLIVNKYDCDLILNTQNIWFAINDFLFIGSVLHIAAVSLLFVYSTGVFMCKDRGRCSYYTSMIYTWLITLLFIVLGIIGLVLYSQTYVYHPCSNVLISWIVLKLIMYIFAAPIAVCVCVDEWFYVSDTYCTQTTYTGFFVICYLLAIIGVVFGTDIAGLVIATNNDCDLTIDGGSMYVLFGVNAYLLSGCSVHLATVLICVIICLMLVCLDKTDALDLALQLVSNGCDSQVCIGCVVVSNVLFSISWAVIGCLLYSEMEQNNVSNKQCADVTISWAVFRFVEPCILPGIAALWAYFHE